jgi:hypothetical protein
MVPSTKGLANVRGAGEKSAIMFSPLVTSSALSASSFVRASGSSAAMPFVAANSTPSFSIAARSAPPIAMPLPPDITTAL